MRPRLIGSPSLPLSTVTCPSDNPSDDPAEAAERWLDFRDDFRILSTNFSCFSVVNFDRFFVSQFNMCSCQKQDVGNEERVKRHWEASATGHHYVPIPSWSPAQALNPPTGINLTIVSACGKVVVVIKRAKLVHYSALSVRQTPWGPTRTVRLREMSGLHRVEVRWH